MLRESPLNKISGVFACQKKKTCDACHACIDGPQAQSDCGTPLDLNWAGRPFPEPSRAYDYVPGERTFVRRGRDRDLRAVYLMAVSAFSQTYHVDRRVTRYLATSVFDACISADFPASPSSMAQIEDMAVLSIQTMLDSHPGHCVANQ